MTRAHAETVADAVSPRKLAHVVLRTRDRYREMVDWYRTVLNARVVVASPFMTFLTYDDEHHRVAIVHTPDAATPQGKTIGLDHLAFTYDSLADLLANHRRLKAAGIEPFCPVNHGPTTSMYYNDPDGNRVELQIDNFTTMEEAVEVMGAMSGRNPLGVLFDPDAFANQLAGGADPAELIRYGPDNEQPLDPRLAKILLG